MAKVLIGTTEFKTKKAAEDFIRKIVDRYENGQTIMGDDDLFLRNLLLLHPDSEQKIGVGIHSFSIRNNPEYRKNREFIFVRINGSSTDFSWNDCINGNSHERDVKKALRALVKDQVIAFKINEFRFGAGMECPLSGELLTESNCHVDHTAPATFKNLISDWLKARSLTFSKILLVESRDNQFVCELADQNLKLDWQQFHSDNAKLRIVSIAANLSKKGSDGYIDK